MQKITTGKRIDRQMKKRKRKLERISDDSTFIQIDALLNSRNFVIIQV